MSQGKSKKVIAAGLLVMSLTMACNSALAPILAEVGKFFPDASDSAIQIVLTLINLVTLPAMILKSPGDAPRYKMKPGINKIMEKTT